MQLSEVRPRCRYGVEKLIFYKVWVERLGFYNLLRHEMILHFQIPMSVLRFEISMIHLMVQNITCAIILAEYIWVNIAWYLLRRSNFWFKFSRKIGRGSQSYSSEKIWRSFCVGSFIGRLSSGNTKGNDKRLRETQLLGQRLWVAKLRTVQATVWKQWRHVEPLRTVHVGE